MSNKNKLVFLGAAQHAEVAYELIDSMNSKLKVVGYFDDAEPKNSLSLKLNKLGSLFEGINYACDNNISVFIGVSLRHMGVRTELLKHIKKNNILMPNLFHEQCSLSKSARVGYGNMFLANSVVAAHAVVGDACVFYSNSVLEHHSVAADNVYFGPGAKTAADVKISSNVILGVNSSVLPHVSLGLNSTVGAGGVVLTDVQEGAVVIGNPAKPKS